MSSDFTNSQTVGLKERILGMVLHISPVVMFILFVFAANPIISRVLDRMDNRLTLAVLFLIALIFVYAVPLFLCFVTRNMSSFLDLHRKEVLNFHAFLIFCLIIQALLQVICLFCIALVPHVGTFVYVIGMVCAYLVTLLMLLVPLAAFICGALAMLGKTVRYPLIVRFIK